MKATRTDCSATINCIFKSSDNLTVQRNPRPRKSFRAWFSSMTEVRYAKSLVV